MRCFHRLILHPLNLGVLLLFTALQFASTCEAAAPANDNFDNAAAFTTLPQTLNGTTVSATAETGEPAHDGFSASAFHSVWWKWTPATTTGVVIDTIGSEDGLSVVVYTGNHLNGLTPLVRDSEFIAGSTTVEFIAVAGTEYHIAVDSVFSSAFATGPVTLHVNPVNIVGITAVNSPASEFGPKPGSFSVYRSGDTTQALTVNIDTSFSSAGAADYTETLGTTVTIPAGQASTTITITPVHDGVPEADEDVEILVDPGTGYVVGDEDFAAVTIQDPLDRPANDDFADRQTMSGGTASVTGTLTNATIERGEPNTSSSVWYKWVAPSTTGVHLTCAGSSHTVSVYTGTSVSGLTLVSTDSTFTTHVGFLATAGTEYQIAVCGGLTSFTLDLTTNEVIVTIAATSPYVEERVGGIGPGRFTFTRTGSTVAALTVNFSDVGFSATNGTDYNTIGTSVTIPAGQSSTTLDIVAIDDSTQNESFGGPEKVELQLSSGAYVIGRPNKAAVYIIDNDDALPTISLQTLSDAYEAGTLPGKVRVTRNGSCAAALQVFLTYGNFGGMTAADYIAPPNSVTIPAGEAYIDLDITPADDSTVEPTEFLNVNIASNAAYTTGSSTSIKFYDNDVPANDDFASAVDLGSAATVNTSGRNNNASRENGEPLHANYFGFTSVWWKWTAPSDGTVDLSTAGSDFDTLLAVYTGTSVSSLTGIASNANAPSLQTSRLTFYATAGTEYKIAVDGYFGAAGAVSLSLTLSAGKPSVNLTSANTTATEGDLDDASFVLTRIGDPTGSLDVHLSFSGSAVNGTDYTTINSVVTIPAGASSTTVVVHPVNDAVPEKSEQAFISIASDAAYVIGGDSSVTFAIFDNDKPVNDKFVDRTVLPPTSVNVTGTNINGTLEFGEPSLDSFDQGSIWWSWTPAVSGAVIVDATSPDVSALMNVYTGTAINALTQVAGTRSNIPTGKRVQFNTTAGTEYIIKVGAQTRGDFNLTIDAGTVVTATATTPTASEGGAPGVFTLARVGDTTAALDVKFGISGTAVVGTNYTAITSPVTIPAGQSSVTVNVSPVENAMLEGTKTVVLTIQSDAAYFIGTPSSATVTVIDNEHPANDDFANAAALNGTSDTQAGTNINATKETGEPDHGGSTQGNTIWWKWVPASSGATTIDFSSSIVPADFSVYSGTALNALTRIGDGDEFSSVLFYASAGTTYYIGVDGHGASQTGTMTVQLDQTINTEIVSISTSDDTASEVGNNTATFTVTREGNIAASLTVDVAIGGSATSGTDYQALPFTNQITFNAGETAKTFTLTAIDDTEIELSENVTVTLQANLGYVIRGATSTGMIILSEDLPPNDNFADRITLNGLVVSASGSNVLATSETSEPVHAGVGSGHSVWWTWTASINSIAKIDTFASNFDTVLAVYTGTSVGSLTEVASNNDSAGIQSKVQFSAVAGTTYQIAVDGKSNAQGTIQLHLIAGTIVSVTANDPSAAEAGGNGQFTISRLGDLQAMTVNYSLGGTATNGTDYQTLPGSIDFTAGQTTATIDVVPSDDTLYETDETATLTLAAGTGYTIDAPNSATVTIADDDFVDVQVTSVSAPAQVYTTTSFVVTWVDANTSAIDLPSNRTFKDKVYLSDDASLDVGDLLLGAFSISTVIPAGQSVTRTQSVTIPAGNTGSKYIIIAADADNELIETAENNNTLATTTPVSVSVLPLPDLVVTSIVVPATPTSNDEITIQYTVKNVGTAATNAAQWIDQVYLAVTNGLDGSNLHISSKSNPTFLNVNESYTDSITYRLPIGLAGPFYVLVYTDKGYDTLGGAGHDLSQSVKELDDSNNFSTQLINIQAVPAPDLVVQNVVAPTTTFSGQGIPVTWTVKNAGPADVFEQQKEWVDKVYLSSDTTLDGLDLEIGSIAHSGVLAINQGYTQVRQLLTVPADVSGDFYVFVVADGDDQVYESVNNSNNAAHSAGQMHVTLTPPPDLIVQNVTVPATAQAGRAMNMSWIVKNQGPGNAKANWIDTVWLSADQTLDGGDTKLATVTRSSDLGGGASYTQNLAVTIPNGIIGSKYIFVATDADDTVRELNAENNNSTCSSAVGIFLSPPDLRVTSVSGPANANAGQPVTVTWTVANQGTGGTLATEWTDRVYLCGSGTFDSLNAIPIGELKHSSGAELGPGATYNASLQTLIPAQIQGGGYFIYVEADAASEVAEFANEGNNLGRSSAASTITSLLPDLQVSSISAPASANTGETIAVSWTVSNAGNGATLNGSWTDSVYLSNNSQFDPNSDLLLGKVIHSGDIAVGQNYNSNANFRLPYSFSGSNFIIVVSDTDNDHPVFEGANENNNVNSRAITINPAAGPDLKVTNITVPATALANQPVTVSWTVTNAGAASTASGKWRDYVYLSFDQVYDPADRLVLSQLHTGDVAASGSYTQSMDFPLPAGLAGIVFVVVRTDVFNEEMETDESNNVVVRETPLSINYPAPAELVASAVSAPASGTPGQTLSVQWRVDNTSGNPADGKWTDSVYLSKDNVFSNDDVLAGSVEHTGGLAAGAFYNGSLNVTVPGLLPGSYYVIVRTDARNTVREVNEANDASSPATVALDIPALTPGTPNSSGTLSQGADRYFKVAVSASQSLLVTLDSVSTQSSNSLAVSYEAIPSSLQADFAQDNLVPDQQVKIPLTKDGTYYIRVHGTDVPDAPASFSITASLLNFSIQSITPASGSNRGNVTATISGARFSTKTTASLVDALNGVHPAAAIYFKDGGTIAATFNLTTLTAGTYGVRVSDGANTATLPGAFTVTDSVSTRGVAVSVFSPPEMRTGATALAIMEYQNQSDIDQTASMLELAADNALLREQEEDAYQDSSRQFLAIDYGSTVAGILPPGAHGSIVVGFKPTITFGDIHFELRQTAANDATPVDWAAMEPTLRPEGVDLTTWNPSFSAFTAAAGPTLGSYVRLLGDIASIASQRGEYIYDVRDLVEAAISQKFKDLFHNVSGRVYFNDFEHPLAAADVTIRDAASGEVRSIVTADDGTFSFLQVPPGTYDTSSEGYMAITAPQFTVMPDQTVSGLELVVSAGGAIRGTVVDGTASPVAGLAILARDENSKAYSTRTDEHGSYNLSGLPAHQYTIRTATSGALADQAKSVSLALNEIRQGVDFTLTPAAQLSGTVRNTSGTPLSGALVRCNSDGDNTTAISDGDGRYTLRPVSSGTYTVTVSLNGYSESNATITLGPGDLVADFDVVLKDQAILTVVCSDSGATPVGGADVLMFNGTTFVHGVTADAAGSAVFNGLAPATYTIKAYAAGKAEASTTTTVSAGDAVSVPITLPQAGTISGSVKDASNNAIPDVHIVALESNGKSYLGVSDAGGSYQITELPMGNYVVVIEKGGSGTSQRQDLVLSAAQPTATADFQISGAQVSGKVLEADNATPISGALVYLAKDRYSLLSTITDTQGNFSFIGLSAGSYSIEASVLRGLVEKTNVTLSAGQTMTGIILKRGALQLTVTVTQNGSGTPLDDAAVYLASSDGALVVKTASAGVTEVDGKSIITGLLPGNYQLKVAKDGYAASVTTVNVASPGPSSASVQLSSGDALTVTVLENGTAAPIKFAQVSVTLPGDPSAIALVFTDDTGVARLRSLADGSYDISVLADGYQKNIISSYALSGNASQTINMTPGNISVSGFVADSSAKPIFAAVVQAYDGLGRVAAVATTGFDGKYQFTTLLPGSYGITIRAIGFSSTTTPVLTVNGGDSINAGYDGILSPIGVAANARPEVQAAVSRLQSLVNKAAAQRGLVVAEAARFVGISCPALEERIIDYYLDLFPEVERFPGDDPPPGPPDEDCDEARRLYELVLLHRRLVDTAFKQWEEHTQEGKEQVKEKTELFIESVAELLSDIAFFLVPEAGFAIIAGTLLDGKPIDYSLVDKVRETTTKFASVITDGITKIATSPAPQVSAAIQSLAADVTLFLGAKENKELLHLSKELSESFGKVASAFDGFKHGARTGDFLQAISKYPEESLDYAKVYVDEVKRYQNDISAYNAAKAGCDKDPDPCHHSKKGKGQPASMDCRRPPDDYPHDPKPHPDTDSTTRVRNPVDPNEKRGPDGYGANKVITTQQSLPYLLFFENKPEASAPAQRIRISDPLDANLDERTFRLGEIVFGSTTVTVPENRSFYQARVQLQTDTALLFVDVVAGIDVQARQAFWEFTAIDPATGDRPIDPNLGLLPPNDGTHRGEGHVTFTIQAKGTAPSGATITNKGTIIFDELESLDTNTVSNVIEGGLPASQVAALQATRPKTQTSFTVSWSGSDPSGPGIQNYDIYVSDNNGPWTIWQGATALTSETFNGQRGHTYRFYSLARNKANGVELAPAVPDAATSIDPNFVPVASAQTLSTNQGVPLSITLSGSDQNGDTLTYIVAGSPGHGSLSGSGAQLIYTPDPAYSGPDTFTFKVNDGEVDSAAAAISVNIAANNAPIFISGPTATPNPAKANESIAFAASASDPEGDPLTYTWSFGDGSGGSGPNTAHAYTSAGTYSATVSVSDGRNTAQRSVAVSVTGGLAVTGSLTVMKAMIKFNFKSPSADSTSVSGIIPLQTGFSPAGKAATVVLGDYSDSINLDPKGKGRSSTGSFKLTGRLKNGALTAPNPKFTFTAKKAPLFDQLEALGFENATTTASVSVPLEIVIGTERYVANMTFGYKATQGRSGSASGR